MSTHLMDLKQYIVNCYFTYTRKSQPPKMDNGHSYYRKNKQCADCWVKVIGMKNAWIKAIEISTVGVKAIGMKNVVDSSIFTTLLNLGFLNLYKSTF